MSLPFRIFSKNRAHMKQRVILLPILAVWSVWGCTDRNSSPGITTKVSERGTALVSDELKFFNSIRGRLRIELTEPPQQMSNLSNEVAPQTAQAKSVRLVAEVKDEKRDQVRPLTPDELNRVAYSKPEIRLKGQTGLPVLCKAPNGKYFTVQDLLAAIEETERRTRGESKWFGGIDVHHIFFEGIHAIADDVYEISWGS